MIVVRIIAVLFGLFLATLSFFTLTGIRQFADKEYSTEFGFVFGALSLALFLLADISSQQKS